MSKFSRLWLMALLALAVTACGGAGAPTPTAIPADVSVPDQPAPIYADDTTNFTVATPAPPIFSQDGMTSGRAASPAPSSRPTIALPYQQTPSALGVVRSGAVLRRTPGGERIASLPAGETVTITGKTSDGRAYAVFLHDATAGWLAANAVTVFGGDDLVTVDVASGPGPIATLVAEAMRPFERSVLEGVGSE